MKEIGIMGGAFNPIHFWHLNLAEWARYGFNLDKVYFVPSGNPPHKKVGLLDKEVRFEMVAAGVKGNEHFIASRLEVDRAGVSWTIDTLDELRILHGDDVRLNFIMGEDNVSQMESYDRRADFQKRARLLIAPRGTFDSSRIEDWRKRLPDGEVELVTIPASALASSDIRKWIAAGKPFRYALPEAVFKIIDARRLYLPEPDSKSAEVPQALEPVVPEVPKAASEPVAAEVPKAA
jgi:nicotinate-nucleotide adenylyltransferase